MYLVLITLPLLSSVLAGLFGRSLGVKGSQLISCSFIFTTTLLALLAFVEVGLNNVPVTINLIR